ncbi:MAG TPA: monovalent cation/H+ antiporter subunit D [Longimicrobiales bacterium]|nr:monovalent cation/H+ antiporter subunit D [Longimicrobiales bacterium]
MTGHAAILPVLLPLFTGIALILLAGRGVPLQRSISVLGAVALVLLSVWLLMLTQDGVTRAYRLGDWPAPFGIVLVLDRLAALMVLLTSIVALFSVLHAVQGHDEAGPFYHPLFQLQLVGLNGAFLTGDLFNLFVFFEILLIASYCLLVFGSTTPRLRAGVHYVVLNLAGSALFLIAVGTLYGVTGTLNMADMAQKVALLEASDAALVRAAALLLLVVFALKAALVPLYFWLPGAYAAASAPVAALFAIMTKVGVYSIIRVYTLVFGADAGVAANVAADWLLPLALVTTLLGMTGALASRELRRMQGYLLVGSVGIMMTGMALFTQAAIAAGLYYLVHSTLVMAGMFLIADLVARQRGGKDDLIVSGPPLPQGAVLSSMFFIGAIAVVGLPPLSGFLGKALILNASLPSPAMPWVWGIILFGGLLSLLALSRAGITMFWVEDPDDEMLAHTASPARAFMPAAGLLAAVVLVSVFAGPLAAFADATAEQLLKPAPYIEAVLGGGAP